MSLPTRSSGDWAMISIIAMSRSAMLVGVVVMMCEQISCDEGVGGSGER